MVKIAEDTPSVLLKGMGGSQIGVWCAHGEGQALFPNDEVKKHVLDNNLAPIRYVDADGQTTEQVRRDGLLRCGIAPGMWDGSWACTLQNI